MAPVIDEGPVAAGDEIGGMAVEQSIEPANEPVLEPDAVEASRAMRQQMLHATITRTSCSRGALSPSNGPQ
jgi:hypothetical protein